MRVATWNIGGGFTSTGESSVYDTEDIDYFIEELASLQADIVCIQEIHLSEKNNQTKVIAEALGFEYVVESFSESHLKEGEMLSIAIMSKFSILSSRRYQLPNPNLWFTWKGERVRSHDKGFLEVLVDIDGIHTRILSGHMVPFRKFGEDLLGAKFSLIRNEIERIILREEIPCIVCADMNFNGDMKQLVPNIFEGGFVSLVEGVPTTPRERTYDKIIVSKHWKLVNSHIKKGKADHFLCSCDIERVSTD